MLTNYGPSKQLFESALKLKYVKMIKSLKTNLPYISAFQWKHTFNPLMPGGNKKVTQT